MNYEQDLRIDDSSLDIELLEQAPLFMKYAKHFAEAQRDVENAKQALDIKRAELDQLIRKNPENYNIEKVTEGAISSSILMNKRYQECNQAFLDAQYEKNMAANAKDAVNQRKEMLEGMIKLLAQQYFAGPSVPRDLSKERELKQKQTSGRIASKLVRNKH